MEELSLSTTKDPALRDQNNDMTAEYDKSMYPDDFDQMVSGKYDHKI